MRQSIAILSFLAGAAYADDVVSFVFPGGFDGLAPVATIESANPSTTSALMTCTTGTPIDECGFAAGLDVKIIGGTRYEASMSAGTVYVSYGCDGYDSKANTMTCTAEMSGEDAQTAVLSGTEVAFITATVVKGAELLSGGASATASASASASAASANASASAPQSSAAAASSGMRTSVTAAAGSHASGVATATASSALPQSTGAAARFGIEGAALLALAGAAAVNAL
ncbi:hypothetical protein BU25DRAFT_414821 [Macroventuria anomochaeta]|uniref:Uncharacterized protein n=1 Tax=Macroventuria anomochaeta TaxID=301207 RepID=A0ACB6RM65_9PLEO|nr:uncharacterized protein BU25DRAFT_414821 [Macroventuria anomochaeta]KAF2622828.1 hypothetical protein BU25DRAFT_414821 [Macroventuria anomochaeta]